MKNYTLENEFQKITFLTMGATIYTWQIKAKNNRNIVLTNLNEKDYLDPRTGYLGATVGRVANRIRAGKFTLNDVEYQLDRNFDGGANAGHGGNSGFWRQPFRVTKHDPIQIVFEYTSPDGHEGYPGTLHLKVTYTLDGHALLINYDAKSDKDTIVNLTNHSYFNLDGTTSILNHRLQMQAPLYLGYDKKKVVSGKVFSTENTTLDFTKEKTLSFIESDPYLQDHLTQGLDHCFIFGSKKALTVKGEDLKLKITTSYPAVQLYSTGFPGPQYLLGKKKVQKYHALAIEPQLVIDAINHPEFGSMTLRKGQAYQHFIRYQVEVIA